jgi:glycosyltransferase involved in cell wall biosynthesis
MTADGRMRSVMVAKFVPWPANSGDKRRTLALARALRRLGPVTVCAFATDDDDGAPLEREGISVRAVPLDRCVRSQLEGLARTRSITAARFWASSLACAVRDEASSGCDVLAVEHIQLAHYARGLDARVRLLDMHNVESLLTARHAATRGLIGGALFRAEAAALRRLESATGAFDRVLVVSEHDERALRRHASPRATIVVPNAWDTPTPLPQSAEPVVSFVALLSWAPNVNAAVWFTEEVWPLVRQRVANARLLLVGRNPAPAVRRLASPTVDVTGTVSDLTPYYARTAVAVAPLLAGGGSRLKILEALAHARPVVATTIGAEGLEDLLGRGVEVADDPAAMAAAIARLLHNPDERRRQAAAGVQAVASDHSWEAATGELTHFLQRHVEGVAS